MVLTLDPAAVSRSKGGPPEQAGQAPAHWSWERDSDRVREKLPAIKVSGCQLVPVILRPAFLTRDGNQPQLPPAAMNPEALNSSSGTRSRGGRRRQLMSNSLPSGSFIPIA